MCMMESCLAAYSFPAKRLCDLAALEHLNIWQLMSRSPSSTAVTRVKIFLKRYTILANWNCGETSHGIREMGEQMPLGRIFTVLLASSLIVLLIFLLFLTTAHYWHLLLFRCCR